MRILDLTPDDTEYIAQAAALLVDSFRNDWPDAWPTLRSALDEVQGMLIPERICRVALTDDGNVAGWIGGVPEYDGNVWQLHPLVVRANQRGRGIGRALVKNLEDQVRARGGFTVRVGMDDETEMTSLGGINLYPDVWELVNSIQNIKHHPYAFYQKLGYTIVGVIPDANGYGRPDILMAKRVGSIPQVDILETEIRLGKNLMRAGDTNACIAHFRDLARRYPDSGRVYFEYANAYDQVGYEMKAAEYLRTALRLGLKEPYQQQALAQLGNSLCKLGEYDEAAKVLKGACARFPEYSKLKAVYALALYHLGEFSEAFNILLNTAGL